MSNLSAQDSQDANPLIRKLGRIVPLGDEERAALAQICTTSRKHRVGSDLIHEGDEPKAVFLMLKGWGYRYKQLADGKRQILAYLLPGDLCDIQIFLFEKMDHSIGLLSDAEVVKIPAAQILALMDRFPRIERAMLWATLVDEATLREWLLNIGQRFALQRLAHLFCELCVRLTVVGLVDSNETFSMPLTQAELADTLGMTSMHVSRVLQQLLDEKLISTGRRRLTILDFKKLAQLGGFNETYLHVDGPTVEQKLRSRLGAST